MTDKSVISVEDYKYDNPLSYESSRSSDNYSDYSKDDHDSRSPKILPNVNMIGVESKESDGYLSDSGPSDDMFLECESDFEYSDGSEVRSTDRSDHLNLYNDSKILDMKNGFSNAANDLNKISHKNASGNYMNNVSMNSDAKIKLISSNNQNFGLENNFHIKHEFDDLLDLDSNPEMKENDHLHSNLRGEFVDPELVVDNRSKNLSNFVNNEKLKTQRQIVNDFNGIDNNSGFRGPIYDVDVSEIGSDMNSEVESRMIDFHEAKKSVPIGEFGSEKHQNSQPGIQEPCPYEPEDEIDEIFDRVINCEYDPDFTFRPEPLDPFVKISQDLIARKNKGAILTRTLWSGRKSSSRSSSSSSASSRISTKDKKDNEKDKELTNGTQINGVMITESKDDKNKPKFIDTIVSSDPSTTDSENSKKSRDEDNEKKIKKEKDNENKDKINNKENNTMYNNNKDSDLGNRDKINIDEISNENINKVESIIEGNDRDGIIRKETDNTMKVIDLLPTFRKVHIMDLRTNDESRDENDIIKTESEVEQEKEKVRFLFESNKPDEIINHRKLEEEEIGKGGKGQKNKEDKKNKKSKHRLDSEADDERQSKSDKKIDKKSNDKGSKSGKEIKNDKSEISEKIEKTKDKKSDRMKKFPWKSTEYDHVFNTLGDCFSSGIIEHDSGPIILPKKGFYTMFFRNSRYPYDSNIDFYLFRIGFKYMLVNESKNQNFNIDDVVDYGNFKIKLSGSLSLSPNVTKMALIYSNSDRQTLDFIITPSAFDSKPKIVYKLFFSGTLLSLPMPIKFKRRLRVLSLDNSENLGTSVIGALYLLEKKLSELKKKKVNLADYFDYICGTGAGALIALCLLKGYSMKDLRAQWNLIVSGLFKWAHSLPSGIIFDYYYIEEFKKNFISILGTDFLCSKPSPLCMVTCTNVRSNPYELFLFRNYGNSKFGSLDGTSYAPLWLVGWAACALPTYVRGPSNSHLNNIGYNMINKSHLVDGCLISSSPSLISLQELTNIYNVNLKSLVTDNMDLFLSIGTSKSETDSGSISSSTWQILLNCKNLMYNTQLQHLHVKSLFDEQDNKYHRIQLPIYPGCKHGKTSKEDVDAVLTSTIQYISRHDNQRIERIVNILNQ